MMGFFDKVKDAADKALKSVEQTKDKVTEIYKKEGIDGFLDRADKGAAKLEDKTNELMDKTVSYAKDIHASNKEKIAKAKSESTDNFDKVVNSGVAATVNTVTTVAKDISGQAKKLVEKTLGEKKSKPATKLDFDRFVEADQVPLVEVMKFIGAKVEVEDKDVYKNVFGHQIRAKGQMWLDHSEGKGGSGAVSLLKHELNLVYKSTDKVKEDKALEKEAIGILEKMSINAEVKKNQEVQADESLKMRKEFVSEVKELVQDNKKPIAVKKAPAKKPAVKKTATPKTEAPIEPVKKSVKTPAKKVVKKLKV